MAGGHVGGRAGRRLDEARAAANLAIFGETPAPTGPVEAVLGTIDCNQVSSTLFALERRPPSVESIVLLDYATVCTATVTEDVVVRVSSGYEDEGASSSGTDLAHRYEPDTCPTADPGFAFHSPITVRLRRGDRDSRRGRDPTPDVAGRDFDAGGSGSDAVPHSHGRRKRPVPAYARASVQVAVVLNPNSRKNRNGRARADELQGALGNLGKVFVTQEPGELEGVLREVLSPELRCLVSVGGDGALHCALNAARPIARDRGLRLPVVLPTNGGTIDFVARRAGVRGLAEILVPRLVSRLRDETPLETIELDSLSVELADDRRTRRVMGFAMAAAGIGQRFFDEYYQDPEPGPATIVAVIARAVASLGASAIPGVRSRIGKTAMRIFRPFEARVRVDGQEIRTRSHGAIHAGAFDVNLGGVVRVFPLAKDDGSMHVQAGELTPMEMIRALPALASGGKIPGKNLTDGRSRRMEVEAVSGERLRPVIDGEIYEGIDRLAVELGERVRIARV